MDESRHAETTGLPLQGPHRTMQFDEQPLPADFRPLRLVNQPGGMVIELQQQDMVIGRHSDADVRLPLPDVSRRHCRFIFGNGQWVVMDLNSLNGVFVNDEPVAQATLKQGDRVRIGGFVFAVDLSSDVAPVADGDSKLMQSLFHTRRAPSTFTQRRMAS